MFAAAGLREVTVTDALRIPREARDFQVLLTAGKEKRVQQQEILFSLANDKGRAVGSGVYPRLGGGP
jgi:hypothetical protein